MENQQKNEDMVKEAVEEAKKAAKDADPEENGAASEETETREEEVLEEEAENIEEQKESKAEEKSFFKKKNKKDKKDIMIEELTDKLTRQMAEFDNFRKRSDKEKSAMYEIGAKDVVEKILPVIDNFERGLQGVAEDQKGDPFVDGMDKIYKQLITTLEEMDVKPIEAVGQEFNPEYHNAVMHEESDDFGDNTVSEEFLKGYTYRDSVVRHSMVKVVN